MDRGQRDHRHLRSPEQLLRYYRDDEWIAGSAGGRTGSGPSSVSVTGSSPLALQDSRASSASRGVGSGGRALVIMHPECSMFGATAAIGMSIFAFSLYRAAERALTTRLPPWARRVGARARTYGWALLARATPSESTLNYITNPNPNAIE